MRYLPERSKLDYGCNSGSYSSASTGCNCFNCDRRRYGRALRRLAKIDRVGGSRAIRIFPRESDLNKETPEGGVYGIRAIGSSASFLLARTIIGQPSKALKALELRPSFLRPEVSLQVVSSWKSEELTSISNSFPGSGIAFATELGLFGTAVGLDPRGQPAVRVVLLQIVGKRFFYEKVLRDPRFAEKPELPIWVVGVNSIKFASKKQRPCIGGISIGPEQSTTTGTLGAWLKCNPSGKFVGISNNHVLAEFGRFGTGTGIIQPGQQDGGVWTDKMGVLEGFVPLKEYDPFRVNDTVNEADVAWFSADDPQSNFVDRSIGRSGRRPTGEENLVNKFKNTTQAIPLSLAGRSSWLAGRSSGAVSGAMIGIRASVFSSKKAGKGIFLRTRSSFLWAILKMAIRVRWS